MTCCTYIVSRRPVEIYILYSIEEINSTAIYFIESIYIKITTL